MFKLPLFASRGNFLFENDIWPEVVLMTLENERANGRHIHLKGAEAVHFGNVSYVGLDTDERLKRAAVEAIDRYGVQFSSSRGFVQLPYYDELEDLLAKMYGRPVLVTPSTTLGHQAAMPIFMHKEDAVLVDYQAHASLQTVLEIVRAKGAHIEHIPHNDLNRLEDRIKALSEHYERVWYVADGVYSMFGDAGPMRYLATLLDRYENFHAYLDDAHGLSWTGKNGAGHVFEQMPMHDRLLLAISLNKGFAAGGGAIVCPNEQVKFWLKRCGSSLVFSGPVQPSALAAGIESARIHLSPEIEARQQKVKSNIRYFLEMADRYNLTLADRSETPIFYIGVGKINAGLKLCKKLREAGFYTNLGVYPAVPINQTGLRISIHYHLEMADIHRMARVLAELTQVVLTEDNSSVELMRKQFFRRMPNKVSEPVLEPALE